jgi:glycosyltransferase involved in cell wall biosynthesis
MPKVSILLTCYNHIAYLPAALDGIRAQTFTDYEIIAIDDGSTDGSRDWLQNQPDIRCIFNETNLGTYQTLNVGLAAASGEFIAVLNDDDVWLPQKLEKQLALFDANPKVGLVHTFGHFIDGNGARQEGNPLGFAFPRFETGDILLGLVYENKIIASAALVRRICFEQVGEFNAAYFGSGDWEMWFRIAEEFEVGCVNEELTLYRVHGANASHKLDRIWRDDKMLRKWINTRFPRMTSRFDKPSLRKAIAFNFAALGTVSTLTGDPAEGRQWYRQSILNNPTRWQSYARFIATFLPPKVFRKLL